MAEQENKEFMDTINGLRRAIGKLTEALPSKKDTNIEKEREQAARENQSNEYLRTIAAAVSGGGAGGGDGDSESSRRGGLLAGIGGALGKMGIGAGVAMGGLGALFAGGGYLLKQIAEFDGKAVVENVKHLLSINDLFTGSWDALKEGGTFFLVMTGIGAGLFAFAIGEAATSMAQTLTRFTGSEDWAKTILKNVTTLIGIQDIKGYDSFQYVKFGLVMGGIGAGLIAFSIGKVAASMSTALTQFMDSGSWAQDVVDNITTLVGIQFITGYDTFGAVGFAATMLGIGAGLIAFSIGTVAASMTTALTQFTDTKNWAQTIYDNIKTLVSISSIPNIGKDTAKFVLMMGGIAAGLVAFAVGKAGNVMGDVISKFSGNFADNIVKDVNTLMTMINDPNVSQKKANEFSSMMGTIALGLAKFSGGKFVSSIAGAASAALNFLTGNKSPITQMEIIAKNAAALETGAAAIGSISENLDKVGNLKFKGGDLGIEDFAEDLLKSIPDIEVAIKGGKVSTGIFSGTTIKGLGSKDIPWDQAGKNLRIIHEALNIPEGGQGTNVDALKGGSDWQNKLQKNIEDLTTAIRAGVVGNVVTNNNYYTRAGDLVTAAAGVRTDGDVARAWDE